MKKSKFLKKSLAMLLALMLVVAMIPLSAAAATFDFSSIYVDGNKVEVGSTFAVDVPDTATEVKVGTNETLADYGYELRAVKATSTVEENQDRRHCCFGTEGLRQGQRHHLEAV